MQTNLFGSNRLGLAEAIALTVESLATYGPAYPGWAIAYSGGKDSTALLSLILHLLDTKRIPAPQSLHVLYADTRQELPPLAHAAQQMLAIAQEKGHHATSVVAPLDKRFWVYILGRGVPSPNNGTLRWCTRQIKVEPMQQALDQLGQDTLFLTGVRLGESAIRDRRILASCSKDGGECGQGWFQQFSHTLAPILHWRACLIWDWLWWADLELGYPISPVAEVYGMTVSDGEENLANRTGCIGCPLVDKDDALCRVIRIPGWAYLAPLLELKDIHRQIRSHKFRLRQPGTRRLKNGKPESNPNRIGPLTLEARLMFLDKILSMQSRANAQRSTTSQPAVDLINPAEETRIRELIAAKTFPNNWSGQEPLASELIPTTYPDGSIQPILF